MESKIITEKYLEILEGMGIDISDLEDPDNMVEFLAIFGHNILRSEKLEEECEYITYEINNFEYETRDAQYYEEDYERDEMILDGDNYCGELIDLSQNEDEDENEGFVY